MCIRDSDSTAPGALEEAVDWPAVAVPQGAGFVEPLRGRCLRQEQPDRVVPEPDVPLPANRNPL